MFGLGGSSFFEAISSHARASPAKAAVVAAESLSYRALEDRVVDAHRRLSAAGLEPSSIAGISIADEVEHFVATLGLLRLGCRQITLATFDSEELRQKLSSRVGVTHVLTLDANSPGDSWVVTRRADRPAPPSAFDDSTREGSIFLKTSGTTGDVNIVEFSQAQLAAQAARHAEYADERLLRLAAIEHNNSKRHRLYCVYAGGTNVFRFDTQLGVPAFCARQDVTCLDISRLHAADLIEQAAHSPSVPLLGNIRLRTGGSAVPGALRKELQSLVTPALFVRYAATECGAIAMAGPLDHTEEDAVGVPLPGVTVEIVDDKQRRISDGEVGEIRLRAEGMASGYAGNAADTEKRFRDGWFYPGDVGSLSEAGVLFVRGRKDDMMILNGLNIFPAELERALESHPAVRAAAALAIPSRVHGQIPVAAVELAQEGSASVAELQRFAREHLALRAPRKIIILPALPRNPQGKLMRRELAKLFEVKPN